MQRNAPDTNVQNYVNYKNFYNIYRLCPAVCLVGTYHNFLKETIETVQLLRLYIIPLKR